MKTQLKLMLLLLGILFLYFGCSKEASPPPGMTKSEQESDLNRTRGAKQISGVGFIATIDECDWVSEGAAYALRMTGDLEGCLYIFIEDYKCFGDGWYYEVGNELFVGTYKGQQGSFRTTYKFYAKYEGCNEDGSYSGNEIFGFCTHPIVHGSGEGVFKGVSGGLFIIDLVQAGRYPYRGSLQF